MILFALGSYLPVSELVKIVAATATVAVAAPSAVSLAAVGLDRRAAGSHRLGAALMGAAACALALLVTIGLFALVGRSSAVSRTPR